MTTVDADTKEKCGLPVDSSCFVENVFLRKIYVLIRLQEHANRAKTTESKDSKYLPPVHKK